MARGWESKSVEDQREAAETRRTPSGPQLSQAELAIARERESLQLSRIRVARDLEGAANPRYREILEKALAHLDARLAELG